MPLTFGAAEATGVPSQSSAVAATAIAEYVPARFHGARHGVLPCIGSG
jgi:hypothetical protein